MRQPCIVLTLVAAAVCFASDAPATSAPKPLEAADRLLIRDAQLALAQAHIARLQAEAQVTAAEAQIGQLVQTLKKQYACQDCTMNADFTWTPAPTPTAKTTPSSTATPTLEGGTNQKKE